MIVRRSLRGILLTTMVRRRNMSSEEKKGINTAQVVAYLTNAFERAVRHLGYKNQRGTELHDLQVEFMWLLYDITNGPIYIVPKRIQEANVFIENITAKKPVGDDKL